MTHPAAGSRRYDFPPLWLVPVLLIVGIGAVVVGSLRFGLPGFVLGLSVVAWLERKADAYVRSRD